MSEISNLTNSSNLDLTISSLIFFISSLSYLYLCLTLKLILGSILYLSYTSWIEKVFISFHVYLPNI